MDVNFTFRNVEPINVQAFKNFAQAKFRRLKKYLIKPFEINAVITTEKFRNIAEVNIFTNGVTLKGTHESDDMYDAILNVIEKVEKQARRQKERQREFNSRQKREAV